MEITAIDLRIGNYVMYAEDQVQFKVIGIDTDGLTVENESDKTWIETNTFEAIPLTETWLKDFGFIYDGGEGWISQIGEHFYFSLRGGFIHKMYRDTKFVGVNFVHELQNLYYELTKTELTLTK